MPRDGPQGGQHRRVGDPPGLDLLGDHAEAAPPRVLLIAGPGPPGRLPAGTGEGAEDHPPSTAAKPNRAAATFHVWVVRVAR